MSFSSCLDTPRLQLRQWRADDRAPFAAMNADARVMEFFPNLLTSEQSDALAVWLADGIDEHGWGFWAVEAPGVAPFIGFVGIAPARIEAPFAPCTEIAWRLAWPFWGKGYAAEAAHAALKMGFELLGLDEIVAFTASANLRSQALMQRLGMRHEAEFFDHPGVPLGHTLRRHILYRLKRPAWDEQRRSQNTALFDGYNSSPAAAA